MRFNYLRAFLLRLGFIDAKLYQDDRLGGCFCETDFREFPLHKYEIIIYWSEEDDAFVAEVPELPARRDTQERALAEINTAVDLWIETAREFGPSGLQG